MAETFDDSGAEPLDRSTFLGTHLFRIIECDRPLAGGSRYVLDGVDRVTVGRGDALHAQRSENGGVVTLDLRVPARSMSSVHARFLRVGRDWAVEDVGSKNGTLVNGVRVTREVVDDDAVIELGHTLFAVRRALVGNEDAREDVDVSLAGVRARERAGILTINPLFARQLDALRRVATSDVNVLVTGESGTGKELVARWLHALRAGAEGPFVAVNCGAIPSSLVESQLFGHVKGAFSGAIRDEEGFVRAARGGTLFLDEIADLPAPAQATLLRVLQEREVVPVGSTRPVKVDFRLVSATHRSLTEMVELETFRRDLYARVAAFELGVPPLRERREDTGILVASLLERILGERALSVALTQDVGRALLAYDWPYNVRELEQCLTTSTALARGGLVERTHLPDAVSAALDPRGGGAVPSGPAAGSADTKLRLELLDQLTRHGGNLADVARAMGKARMQIHRWCKRFGIDPNVFRR